VHGAREKARKYGTGEKVCVHGTREKARGL